MHYYTFFVLYVYPPFFFDFKKKVSTYHKTGHIANKTKKEDRVQYLPGMEEYFMFDGG